MKSRNRVVLAAAVAAAFVAPAALAQSSGNFAASIDTTQCTLAEDTGVLSGGILPNGDGKLLLSTTIKTPATSQTALVITPSLVTGLYTNTMVSESLTESSVAAGVVVKVRLDGKPVAPGTTENPGVIYDKRFQQISTNIFDAVTECSDDDGNDEECYLQTVQSTLSAHSFNFIAPSVGGGTHALEVEWEFQCFDNAGAPTACTTTFLPNTAGACAGPGTVTVQQVKAFTQSGGITIK